MRYAWRYLSVFLLLFGALLAYGQRSGQTSFGAADSFATGDSVDLTTLVNSFSFPVLNKAQGMLPGSIHLESPQACHYEYNGTHNEWTCSIHLITGSNLSPMHAITLNLVNMSLVYTTQIQAMNCHVYTVTGLLGIDGLSLYPLPSTQVASANCGYPTTVTKTTTDGTGLSVNYTATVSNGPAINTVTNASGWVGTYSNTSQGLPQTAVKDTFGNTATYVVPAGANGSFTDTLGAVITLGSATSGLPPTSYQYTDTNGSSQSVTFTLGTATSLQTLLQGVTGCTAIVNGANVTPITAINYPDSTSIGITWQTNNGGLSGLIGSITLRTGGSVSYTYSTPNTGACNVPNPGPWYYTSLSRTDPDGTKNYTLSISGNTTTTTVVDPGGNKIVYVFLGTPGNTPFLQSVSRYQNTGTVASPAYTEISSTCYGYNTASCSATTSPTLPITQRDTYQFVYASGTTQEQMSHRVELYDSTYGLLTSDALTDSTGSAQTKTTAYVYGDYSGTYPNGSCAAIGSSINDHVCTATTKVGTVQIAQTANHYNLSGAPLSSVKWLSNSGNTPTLTTGFTPNTNGTIASIADPNGQTTSYTYGNCNSLLPTDVSNLVDNKMTWSCNGAVVTGTTDPNGNTTSTTYDSMIRPHVFTDQLGNQTTYTYGTPTLDHTKITDPFGVVSYAYVDTLGRPSVSQKCQTSACSNYDTVSKGYGWKDSGNHALTNFQTTTSVPCVMTTLNSTCPTTALTALSNPVAGPISTTDVNTGTATFGLGFSSSGQDSSVTAGPAPSGEHTKIAQTEKDGWGRVKSFCSLQNSGGNSCGQALGNSGILTSSTYSFDGTTGAPKVVTTRGSQSHTVIADAAGRTTSIQTPEAGTITNTYDLFPSGTCQAPSGGSYRSDGDLVATQDGAGNNVCYEYDGLHRVIQVTNNNAPSGTTNLKNACKRFRYDSTANSFLTAPSGYPSTGNNIAGHMFEAETDDCAITPTTVTDEWFAYDKDGRMTDMWEWTSASSGYYHTTVAYNSDGAITSIGGIPGLSTLSFNVDGESRPFNAQLGSTWVIGSSSTTGVSFDAASKPTTVPIGTATNPADSDTFAYDGLEQMKSYSYSVNGTTMSANVNWNANGSLGSVAITDGFNSGGTQTCSFVYDDVARLTSDTCLQNGSSFFTGTYSYSYGTDTNGQYENLTKTGSITWNPGYDLTHNQPTCSPNCYDGAGRTLYDLTNTYTWSVYGKMANLNAGQTAATCGSSGVCMVNDALGRLVQTNAGGTVRQILYAPAVGRVAKMNAQTLVAAYLPLPGGLDLWSSTSANYISHPDWLGTKRFTHDLAGRNFIMDTAYSPYGDEYATFGSSFKGDFTTMQADILPHQLFDTPNRELTQAESRWESCDPAFASWNCYSYPTDPNRQTDPRGADWKSGIAGWSSLDLLPFNMGFNYGCNNYCEAHEEGAPADAVASDFIAGAEQGASGRGEDSACGGALCSPVLLGMAIREGIPGQMLFDTKEDVITYLTMRNPNMPMADKQWIADKWEILNEKMLSPGFPAESYDPYSWAAGSLSMEDMVPGGRDAAFAITEAGVDKMIKASGELGSASADYILAGFSAAGLFFSFEGHTATNAPQDHDVTWGSFGALQPMSKYPDPSIDGPWLTLPRACTPSTCQ